MASPGHKQRASGMRIEITSTAAAVNRSVSKHENFTFSSFFTKRRWNLNRWKIHNNVTWLFFAIVLFSWPTNATQETSFQPEIQPSMTRRPWPSHEFLQGVIKLGDSEEGSRSLESNFTSSAMKSKFPAGTAAISDGPQLKSLSVDGAATTHQTTHTNNVSKSYEPVEGRFRARDTTSLSVLQEAQLKASERRISDSYLDLNIPVEVSTGESVPFRVFRPKSKLPPLPSDLSSNFKGHGSSSTRNEYVQDGPLWWTEAEEKDGWNSFPTKAPELMRLTWPYTKYPTTHRRTWSTSSLKRHHQSTPATTQLPTLRPQTSTSTHPFVKASRKTTSTAGHHRETQMQPVPIIIVTTPAPAPQPQYVSILNSNQISNHHWGSVGALPLGITHGVPSTSASSSKSPTTVSPTFPSSGPTTVWYKPVINHNYGPSGSSEVQTGFGAKTSASKRPGLEVSVSATSKAPENPHNSIFVHNKTSSNSQILFRVWNLVNGSLQLTSETSVPQWLVEHIQLNSSSTLLNTNELPRAIQRLVAEQGILVEEDGNETSSEVHRPTSGSSSSNALRKRQGLLADSEDDSPQGSWHTLSSSPNKHNFRRAPQPVPVVHYVLWPPGTSGGGGAGGKFESPASSFQQRPFRHDLSQDQMSDDYSHSQDASWTRIKEYLDRQKFANSYPYLLPLAEPNANSQSAFLQQDVSNLIAASLILSYLNQDNPKQKIPPNLSSILNQNSPPPRQPYNSQSSSSSLIDFLSNNPVVSAVEETLDRLVPSLSHHRHGQNQKGKKPKDRKKHPLRDRTGLAFLRPKSTTPDTPEDTEVASTTTSQTPLEQADKRKTLLIKKLVKKKLKKKLKKKKKKKPGGGYFPDVDLNFDFGIDVVDLVKKKFVYLLTLKYAPIVVLTLATLAPTLLIYVPLLLKAFSKSWKHLDDDDDDEDHKHKVHHVVHGPPGGWGWQQQQYPQDRPPSGPPGPPGPSSAYSHLNMHQQGPPMDHVPGPPYEGPPHQDQAPQQQYQDHWYGTIGPPIQPPASGYPTGPFQYTENDAEGYMHRIREIGRGLGELIGQQMSDPANQDALKVLIESKKDGVSSILNKMFEFRPQDFLPKFKESAEHCGRSSKSSTAS